MLLLLAYLKARLVKPKVTPTPPPPPSILLGFHNNSHGCQEALFEYILAYELNT